MPDLNWENEETRKAIYDSAVRFWLDRGIDGFRVDTANKYSKRMEFVDAPLRNPDTFLQSAPMMWCNGPRIHEFLRELHAVMEPYGDVMTVGELASTPDPADVLRYVSAKEKQLSMVLHLDAGALGMGWPHKYDMQAWTLTDLRTLLLKWQTFIDGTDGWTSVFLENHDSGRSVSRYGSDAPEWREVSAKMLAMMLVTLTGTLFVYQGQEIGMINAPADWPMEEFHDIEAQGQYKEAKELAAQGVDPTLPERVERGLRLLGRDHARLPMQWDDSAHAGFTQGPQPWRRVHDGYREINVERQRRDPASVLWFWKQMLKMRKTCREVFVHGRFEMLDADNGAVLSYAKTREELGQRVVVVLNFGPRTQRFPLLTLEGMKMAMCNYAELASEDEMQPYEGRIYTSVEN